MIPNFYSVARCHPKFGTIAPTLLPTPLLLYYPLTHCSISQLQMPLQSVDVEADPSDATMFNVLYGKEAYLLACVSEDAKDQWLETLHAAV